MEITARYMIISSGFEGYLLDKLFRLTIYPIYVFAMTNDEWKLKRQSRSLPRIAHTFYFSLSYFCGPIALTMSHASSQALL